MRNILVAMLAASGAASVAMVTPTAEASTETPVASFSGSGPGSTGANSYSNLTYVHGFFYGTTSAGGQYGQGTLFRWQPSNNSVTVLHDFQGGTTDGSTARAGVIYVKGALFGTTQLGGSGPVANCSYYGSCGIVFKYDLYTSTYSVLHHFQGGADGSNPYGGLTLKGAGPDFYGTTILGGQLPSGVHCVTTYPSCGTVFFMTFGGVHTVVHNFAAGANGANPIDTLLYLGGALVGTAGKGGLGCGAVPGGCGTAFRLTPGNPWVETTLHSFNGGSAGEFPYTGLTQAGSWFYGTTLNGGNYNAGVVYRLNNTPNSYQQLNSFFPSDGLHPQGRLTAFTNGKLYGTTGDNGLYNPACKYFYTGISGYNGCGSVYEVDPTVSPVTVTTKTYFMGGAADGANPVATDGMTVYNGDLYGTTWDGGASNVGTIFKFTP